MVGKRVLLQDSPFSRFINHEAQLPQQHTLPLVQSCLLVQELGEHMCVCACEPERERHVVRELAQDLCLEKGLECTPTPLHNGPAILPVAQIPPSYPACMFGEPTGSR